MKVLLAIDGSTQSFSTVQALAHFGPLEEVTLLHTIPLPDLDHPMISPEMLDQGIKEMEEEFFSAVERLKGLQFIDSEE